MEKSGVYKVKCDFVYISQSGRFFKTRLKGHLDLKRPSHVKHEYGQHKNY